MPVLFLFLFLAGARCNENSEMQICSRPLSGSLEKRFGSPTCKCFDGVFCDYSQGPDYLFLVMAWKFRRGPLARQRLRLHVGYSRRRPRSC